MIDYKNLLINFNIICNSVRTNLYHFQDAIICEQTEQIDQMLKRKWQVESKVIKLKYYQLRLRALT